MVDRLFTQPTVVTLSDLADDRNDFVRRATSCWRRGACAKSDGHTHSGTPLGLGGNTPGDTSRRLTALLIKVGIKTGLGSDIVSNDG